jgi:hypothetical protein
VIAADDLMRELKRGSHAALERWRVEDPRQSLRLPALSAPRLIDGIRLAVENRLGLSLTLLNVAPTVVVWIGLLFFPVRFIIRRTWARG